MAIDGCGFFAARSQVNSAAARPGGLRREEFWRRQECRRRTRGRVRYPRLTGPSVCERDDRNCSRERCDFVAAEPSATQ